MEEEKVILVNERDEPIGLMPKMEAHEKARIDTIETEGLVAAMQAGKVAVIPGFQGLMDDNRVATLGRGGSDTTAVALAVDSSQLDG